MRDVGIRGLAIFAAFVVLLWLFLIISADARQDDESSLDFSGASIPHQPGGSDLSFGGTSELDLIFDSLDGGF